MGGGVPNDGTAGRRAVHAAHRRGCDGSVFPSQREVGTLAGAAFSGGEDDFIRGL